MPSSGRWVVLFTGRVSPPGGEFLSARAERNERAAKGWAQSAGTALPPLPPCCTPPGPPFYGGYPLGQAEHFRRAKFERVFKFPPGHWALGLQRLPLLRFHNCAWLCRANAPGPFSAVGATLRSPGTRVGQCPAPTKRRNRFQFCRRGGCPHPPTLKGFSPFVGRGLLDAPLQIAAEKRRRGGYQPPASLRPSREKVPSVCEADEGGLRNGRSSSAGRPVSGPYEKKGGLLCSP